MRPNVARSTAHWRSLHRLVHIIRRQLREPLATLLVESNVDDVLLVFRINSGLSINQIITLNAAQPTHSDRRALARRSRRVREYLAAWRGNTLLHIGRKCSLIDQFELQFSRLAQQILQLVGVL